MSVQSDSKRPLHTLNHAMSVQSYSRRPLRALNHAMSVQSDVQSIRTQNQMTAELGMQSIRSLSHSMSVELGIQSSTYSESPDECYLIFKVYVL